MLVFFAAQFVAFFNWTNLGLIVAVEGAAVLKALGARHRCPLMLSLRRRCRRSSTSPWAAPRRSGPSWRRCSCRCSCCSATTPEFTQAAYRVGDSVHEHHLADDVVLRAHHRVRAALRAEGRASARSWR
ncbi:MAG: AbgT family transporter [Desulfobacterales bacterium]|nr:AbgT family transporter [Desulfobacterales bacterium]